MQFPWRDAHELALVLPVVLHPEARHEVHGLFDHRREVLEPVAEGAGLLLGAALAEAHVEPAVRQDVERGGALCDLHRVVHRRREADHAVPDADARGAAREVREERLGHAHVRVLLERGVLDAPHGVEAEAFGEQRLLHDVVQDLGVAFARRVGGLRLVDQ